MARVHGQPPIGSLLLRAKGYDTVNQVTHEHKEAIKVGYNLRRKVILHWCGYCAVRAVAQSSCSASSSRKPARGLHAHVGEIWLVVGIGALLLRTIQLFFVRTFRPAWCGSPRSSPIRSTT